MIVAFYEMDGGPALIARAMVAASEAPALFFAMVSCPAFALGSSLSLLAFSWAPTVKAPTINRPAATAMAFRIASSIGRDLGVAAQPRCACRIGSKRDRVKWPSVRARGSRRR